MYCLLLVSWYSVLKGVLDFDDTSPTTMLQSLVSLILRIGFCSIILNFIYYNNYIKITKMFKSNKVKSLRDQSSKSLSIFNKTLNNLLKINKTISEQIKKNRVKVSELELENSSLTDVKMKNEETISKIKSLIN